MFTPTEWHQRFKLQAGWTQQLRRFLLTEVISPSPNRVLEVGCGSGAVIDEIHNSGLLPAHTRLFGLDIRFDFLQLAQARKVNLTCANAYSLPFPSHSFDLVYCHFLLLWLKNPLQALMEMRRVTQSHGWVIAMAEPDYAHRIDYPSPLSEIGKLQRQSLIQQGANPDIGCMLAGLFMQAGFRNVKTGLLGGEWNVPQTESIWKAEWHILEADLQKLVSPKNLQEYRQQDASAWQKGERILFVPTFYAIGQSP